MKKPFKISKMKFNRRYLLGFPQTVTFSFHIIYLNTKLMNFTLAKCFSTICFNSTLKKNKEAERVSEWPNHLR